MTSFFCACIAWQFSLVRGRCRLAMPTKHRVGDCCTIVKCRNSIGAITRWHFDSGFDRVTLSAIALTQEITT